ncbi:MAG: glycosyl hydrolase family 95 catalytic domain-containing protein, partial [Bacteroidota bacterium]
MRGTLLLPAALVFACLLATGQPSAHHNLSFPALASTWDESLPLGNGMLGQMVWARNGNLRFSLDRADLWDERKVVDFKVLNYKWVLQQYFDNNYTAVQQYGDVPYEEFPYPTKIPGAALEFALNGNASNRLDIRTAEATAAWGNGGTTLTTFVHATKQVGVFLFDQAPAGLEPVIIPPVYRSGTEVAGANSVEGQSLERLGYPQGVLKSTPGMRTFRQTGALGFSYEVCVMWKRSGNRLFGVWTIQSGKNGAATDAGKICSEELNSGFGALLRSHREWWKQYWNKSSVKLPDPLLDRQYHLELYKLGAVARKGAPAITLQGIWTADNGKLPPWKGDFHHDLNTQLSYWPAYTCNRLDIAETFTDWLWAVREENRQYTKDFFGV